VHLTSANDGVSLDDVDSGPNRRRDLDHHHRRAQNLVQQAERHLVRHQDDLVQQEDLLQQQGLVTSSMAVEC
jgi:hypothetical protein